MLKKSEPHLSYTFPRTKKKIKNRSVLAAMTNKQSHGNGVISNQEIKWLSRRAKDGFGIITTAATHVSKYGQGWEGEFGVFEDSFIDRLTLLTKNIHKYDSLIFAQFQPIPSSISESACNVRQNGGLKSTGLGFLEFFVIYSLR